MNSDDNSKTLTTPRDDSTVQIMSTTEIHNSIVITHWRIEGGGQGGIAAPPPKIG